MVTNNPNITGEPMMCFAQPLPSFAQIQGHRFGIQLMGDYDDADVGGQGPATAPFTNITNTFYSPEQQIQPFADDGEYKVTLLAVSQIKDELPYSPPNHNNNLPNEHAHNQNLISTDGVIFNDTRLMKIKQEPMDIKVEPEEYVQANYNGNIFQAQQPKQQRNANVGMLKTKAAPAIKGASNKKKDYEEGSGSPQITSTVQQPKVPGVHKCYDCDKTFNKACYLTQHNKTFHCGDKPFKCSRCGKRFSGDIQYQEHLTKHAGDKPYKCDQCPKQFNHKTDLRRHMCLHSGSKPYACETCGKGFIRKDHMLKHCETHTKKVNKSR